MASLTFNIAKKRRLSLPAQPFADPEPAEAEQPVSEKEKDESAQLLQDEGNRCAESNQHSAAIRLYDRALLVRPSSAVLHELKAQVYLAAEQPWAAIQSASQATRHDPLWPDGFLTLGRAQYNFGEPEEALKSMEEVLKLQPGNPSALEEIVDIRRLVQQRRENPTPLRALTVRPG